MPAFRKFDLPSLKLYPTDGDRQMVPVKIIGDGNCLYRCASLALWGTEEGHIEVRLRTVIEMCMEENYYMDSLSMSAGLEEADENLIESYSLYMETFTPDLTSAQIQQAYR